MMMGEEGQVCKTATLTAAACLDGCWSKNIIAS